MNKEFVLVIGENTNNGGIGLIISTYSANFMKN